MVSGGVKDKDAVSLLDHAQPNLTLNSALPPAVNAPTSDVVVVVARPIPELTVAVSSSPRLTMIVITLTLTPTPDSPVSNLSEEVPTVSASPVPLTQRALDLQPLSASSTVVVDLEAVLNLPLTSDLRASFVPPRVRRLLVDMLVLLTAPTH